MEPLRREVLVPVPSHRRPASLIGLSIVMVLFASAVDALVWSYQAQRAALERQDGRYVRARPCRAVAPAPAPAPASIRRAPDDVREMTLRPAPLADE